MRLVTFDVGAGPRAGFVLEDTVLDLSTASGGRLPARVIDLLAQEGGLEAARELAGDPGALNGAGVHPLTSVRLLAPVPRPGRVAALGLNYVDHAAEGGAAVPSDPIIFSKAPTSVIAPSEANNITEWNSAKGWANDASPMMSPSAIHAHRRSSPIKMRSAM